MEVALAAKCGVALCVGRPLVSLQGEAALSVAFSAAQQVSADFLTLLDSKLWPHRLVNSSTRKSQQDNTQFRGLEAKSQEVAFLSPFFLPTDLSFFHCHFLSSLKGIRC